MQIKLNNLAVNSVMASLLIFSSLHQISAAENQVALQLTAARTVMQQLDQFAGACVDTEQQSSAQDAPCREFLEALNGEVLKSYIDNCRSTKAWRDEFVSSQSNTSAPPIDANESLELMIEVEYLCGEDALLKRTEFIALAYQQLNNTNRLEFPQAGDTTRELQEFRQDLLISRERNRLMNSFQQQQLKRQQETQRQIDRQELEFIRQQTDPLNRY
jgi:hypothetical protein